MNIVLGAILAAFSIMIISIIVCKTMIARERIRLREKKLKEDKYYGYVIKVLIPILKLTYGWQVKNELIDIKYLRDITDRTEYSVLEILRKWYIIKVKYGYSCQEGTVELRNK